MTGAIDEGIEFEEDEDGTFTANIVTSPQKSLGSYLSPRKAEGSREECQKIDPNDIAFKIRAKRAYIWAFGKNSDGELGISS